MERRSLCHQQNQQLSNKLQQNKQRHGIFVELLWTIWNWIDYCDMFITHLLKGFSGHVPFYIHQQLKKIAIDLIILYAW